MPQRKTTSRRGASGAHTNQPQGPIGQGFGEESILPSSACRKPQRNPDRVPPNGRGPGSKQRFVRKTDVVRPQAELVSDTPGQPPEPEPERPCVVDKVKTGFLGAESSDLVWEKELDDVGSRLMKLRLFSEKPELSEEQFRMNDQLQENEVLALESIFGDNVLILDRAEGLRRFQINVHIEALNGITVITKLGSSASDESSDGFSYSFNVQHLPPIALTCLLPKSYPSHQPPHFTISVQWLDSARITSLCSMLDSKWMDQPGQEVIYGWVDWLQNSSLYHLGFDGEITLGPYGVEKIGDQRAISWSVSPDMDVPSLQRYNDEQCHENFLKTLQECCICYREFLGKDFIKLPCQHFFCATCMKTYSFMHVAEGTVNKLHCPEAKCGGMIPPGLLKRLLGSGGYERWESLMLQKTLDSMPDLVYCPRCETPCIEDEVQHAQCTKCFFSFCTQCRDRRHAGTACLTPELKIKLLEDRQNSQNMANERRRKELEKINDLLSVREALRDAKQCPSCKMAISRIEGCDKMVCGNCGQFFCYRCNKAINGYDHFEGDECDLYAQVQFRQRREHQISQAKFEVQIVAEVFGGIVHACPSCRQINLKVKKNNHIFCRACRQHYCFMCRKIVRLFSEHYGPKGCKQHTANDHHTTHNTALLS